MLLRRKAMATINTIVGGIALIYALLVALGVDISQDLQTAITGVAGLVVLIVNIWLNPDIEIGPQAPVRNEPEPPERIP